MTLVPVFDKPSPGRANTRSGFGAITTPRGDLPLEALAVRADITGLMCRTDVRVTFRNVAPIPIEATYILPLPDNAALTAMRFRIGDRLIDATLRERGNARDVYDAGIAAGGRAAIVEQERANIFTIRVGSLSPGERIEVQLALTFTLDYSDGQAAFCFPLVVAPRYHPGVPLDGPQVGLGVAADTDLVPDASRISPPVLPWNSADTVDLTISATVARQALPIVEIGCTIPARITDDPSLPHITVDIEPNQRLNRDFVLRLSTGQRDDAVMSLSTVRDVDGPDGTFALTVLPPTTGLPPASTRNVVVVLDSSAAMAGWPGAAGRRGAARIVDMLTPADRFAVLTVADTVVAASGREPKLVPGIDRNRFAAVEHLTSVRPGGGAHLGHALDRAVELLASEHHRPAPHHSILVVITAGQVGDDDDILGRVTPARFAAGVGGMRIHSIGIGTAVNSALLRQLASTGRGEFHLAESEDQLDALIPRIRRLLGPPLLTRIGLTAEGMEFDPRTLSPAQPPDVYPGAALVITGRCRAGESGRLMLSSIGPDGRPSVSTIPAVPTTNLALTTQWARGHLGDLQRRYATCPIAEAPELAQRIVATSIRFGIITRLTAFVAVSGAHRNPNAAGGQPHQVVQPVEYTVDWTGPDEGSSAYSVEYAKRVTPTPPPFDTPSPPQPSTAPRAQRRGVLIGAGVTVIAALIGVGAVVTTVSSSDSTSDGVAQPAPKSPARPGLTFTNSAPPPAEADPGQDSETAASLTVVLTPRGTRTEISARAAGIPTGEPVRLVVVGSDGTRSVVDAWTVEAGDPARAVLVDLPIDRIARVTVESATGFVYVTTTIE